MGEHRAMEPPTAYASMDDATLVRGCIADDPAAWEALLERHARLIDAVILRVLDERRPGDTSELPIIHDVLVSMLKRNQAGPFRVWSGRSLRHYLIVLTRQAAGEHVEDATPTASLVSALPTPASIFLDDLVGIEPAKKVAATLDRLSPYIRAIVRLRLRGIGPEGIAAAVGMPLTQVMACLERIAGRLGGHEPHAVESWRMLLGCASLEERVRIASMTRRDEEFGEWRSMAENTWRAVGARSFTQLLPLTPQCFDALAIAAFVEGTVRGPDRALAESHLATCGRCIDTMAMVVLDAETQGPLRDAAAHGREVALSAACTATERFLPGLLLVDALGRRGEPRARDLARLAHLGTRLEPGGRRRGASEASKVMATMPVPCDAEAPIVAAEALTAGDFSRAYRAIDDYTAKSPLGARLRLMAAGSGHDLKGAADLAEKVIGKKSVDPGLLADARSILALAEGESLPDEILAERLRRAIPDLVRFVVRRA